MLPPSCPTHDRLLLDLALGRLDDRQADRAEAVRSTCPVCRQWWKRTFSSDAARSVEAAVSAALDSVELPRRHHAWRWLAAAAAVVIAAASLLLLPGPAPSPAPAPRTAATSRPAAESKVLVTMTFESEPTEPKQPPLMQDGGFESGELGPGWSLGT